MKTLFHKVFNVKQFNDNLTNYHKCKLKKAELPQRIGYVGMEVGESESDR
ncbi:hypothetical protein [Coleofasciculus sp. F4-SAH-05]